MGVGVLDGVGVGLVVGLGVGVGLVVGLGVGLGVGVGLVVGLGDGVGVDVGTGVGVGVVTITSTSKLQSGVAVGVGVGLGDAVGVAVFAENSSQVPIHYPVYCLHLKQHPIFQVGRHAASRRNQKEVRALSIALERRYWRLCPFSFGSTQIQSTAVFHPTLLFFVPRLHFQLQYLLLLLQRPYPKHSKHLRDSPYLH